MDNDRRNRQPMRRAALLVLGLVLAAGLVAAVVGQRALGQTYTVAQVRAGLAQQPAAWAGRTVLVRGTAAVSSWAMGSRTATIQVSGIQICGLQSCPLAAPNGGTVYLTLIDSSVPPNPRRPVSMFVQANTPTLVLVVQPVAPNPLIALASRLPALTRFLPTPGQVPGGVAHLYRVRLRPTSSAPCANLSFTCADGVLVDAQP